jgi:fructose-1,6-bisphosphatase
MDNNSTKYIENRKNIYYSLNNKLSYLSDDKIKKMITDNEKKEYYPWGINKIITLKETKIFIKAIPVAQLFNECTSSNLYNIPSYYNYDYLNANKY